MRAAADSYFDGLEAYVAEHEGAVGRHARERVVPFIVGGRCNFLIAFYRDTDSDENLSGGIGDSA